MSETPVHQIACLIIEDMDDFKKIKDMVDEDQHRWRGRCQSVPRINHANLVGVIDPTGEIPSGKVFIPRMGRSTPSRVFLTRVRHLISMFLINYGCININGTY